MAFSDRLKMPMFDPKVMTFQQYVEDIYEIKAWGFDWDANKKLRHLALILPSGWCTKVFRDMPSSHKVNYDALKTQLIKELDRTDEKRQTAASDFHRLSQKYNETIDEYGHRLYRKVEEAYPSFAKTNKEELCAQRFLEGLRSAKVREQLHIVQCQSSKPEKFDKLIDIARRLVDNEKIEQYSTPSESVMRVRCSYCRKPGHSEFVCRKKKRDNTDKKDQHPKPQSKRDSGQTKADWIKSAKCYNCSSRGHLSRDCPQKKVNNITSDNPCPTKSVTLGAMTSLATIDSGAAVSCISVSLLTTAFPHGYELSETQVQLSGPGSSPIQSLGTISTTIYIDQQLLPCVLHVLNADDDTFLLGWNFLSQFKKVVMKPQEKDIELRDYLSQSDDSPVVVRANKTTHLPPRSQKVLAVSVLRSNVETVQQTLLLERSEDFESRTGLLVGRCVSQSKDTNIVVFNPESVTKKIYRCQTVGYAYNVDLEKQSICPSSERVERQVMNVSSENIHWNIGNVDENTKSSLMNLLDRYQQTVFSGLGTLKNYQFTLRLKNDADLSKVTGRRRHYNPFMEKQIETQVTDMLAAGIIENSTSDIISPVVLVKKPDGSVRFCLDFRALNKELLDVVFPLMTTNEALMRIQNSKYFTVLDMRSAFNQVELSPNSRQLTSFQTSSGVYQFSRLCFGLKVAPLAFQRIIHLVLSGLTNSYVMVYLDDCCIHTSTVEEHLNCLQTVLQRFEGSGLTLKAEKCHFFMENVNYLGFKISANGVQPGDKGLKAIHDYPIPETWESVRSFLGLCAYFMRFIPNYSDVALPLSKLVETRSYKWTANEQNAFSQLKMNLVSPPVLKHPDFSVNSPKFIVQTDASCTGLAGVLLQADHDGLEHPICYASKKLNKTERNYSTIHREALGLIWSVRKFREYLYGRKFVLRTDHRPLTFIHSSNSPKFARWSLELADYQYDIEYVKGEDNVVSDTLSRAPTDDTEIDLPVLAVTRSQTLLKSQTETISKAHGIGHFGANRTLELARLVDQTISLSHVKDFISKCINCMEGPHVVKKSTLGTTNTAQRPWELVHCDFVGPLPRTSAGYEYIFTYKDDLTRFVLAWPLRSATIVAATTVMDRLVSIFGPPQKLHSDNGSVFTSPVFVDYCTKRNIECHYTPVARPQANPVERAHRTLKESLSKTCETEKDWDKVLPDIVAAHNAVANRTTGIAPFYAMFGRSSPVDRLITDSPSGGEEETELLEIWNFCHDRQISTKQQRQISSDKGVDRQFVVDQAVAFKVQNGPKFRKKHFERGFTVTKVYGDFVRIHKADRHHRQDIIVSKDLIVPDTTV